MADFHIAAERTIKLEGGFSHHPADTGGRTAYGISEKWFPEAWEDGEPTRSVAFLIYRDHFWLPLRCNLIDSQNIANELFDTGVNCGIGKAAEWLQEAINAMAVPGGGSLVEVDGLLLVDGRIGPKTINATNAFAVGDTARAVFNFMNFLQGNHYYDLDHAVFLRGWFAHRIGGWVDYE